MPAPDLDAVRQSVLDQMERSHRLTTLAIVGAAIAEAALFAVAFLMVDWSDHLQRLLFLCFTLSYTILALGLMALGGHVSRSVGRVLAALDSSPRR
jgi:hypothetical protein